MLWIIDPNPFIRASLQDSLAPFAASLWPDYTVDTAAPDEIAAKIKDKDIDNALFLSKEPLTELKPSACILLDKPRRLSEWVRLIDRHIQARAMPTELTLCNGTITLNTRTRTWHTAEHETELTEKELAMILYMHRRGAPVSREDLLRDVWLYAPDADTHTVETHIYRLRRKIEPQEGTPRFLITKDDGYSLAAR